MLFEGQLVVMFLEAIVRKPIQVCFEEMKRRRYCGASIGKQSTLVLLLSFPKITYSFVNFAGNLQEEPYVGIESTLKCEDLT